MADKPICSIEGCDNNAKSIGWCQKHYMRFWRHGSPSASAYRRKGSTDPLPISKMCVGCQVEKPVSEFGPRPERTSGLRPRCKECERRDVAEYRMRNPEKGEAYRKANPEVGRAAIVRYRARNRELIQHRQKLSRDKNREQLRAADRERYSQKREQHLERDRIWREANREKLREQARVRRERDLELARRNGRRHTARRRATPRGRLENAIRTAIYGDIKRGSKVGRKTFTLLGYTCDELKIHLERQFTGRMSWGNHGRNGWHIDHIIPVASFKFETPDDPDFKVCWALSNLRPLWSGDNRAKHAKRLHLL